MPFKLVSGGSSGLASVNLGVYGNGLDGAGSITGNTTLTQDGIYTNLAVDAGVTLTNANYRIYVNGTLTLNGVISCAGPVGLNGGNGGAGWGTKTLGSSSGGGNGGTTTGNMSDDNTSDAIPWGGQGGTGGNGTSGNGGVGGAVTRARTTNLSPGSALLWAGSGADTVNAFKYFGGGSGGGGGGGDGAAKGGGGGAGGGVVFIAAKTIIIAATGIITVAGGNGGNGATGDTGGGGGGGGGLVVLMYDTLINDGSISVAGGTKGVKSGSGTDGADGSAGVSFSYQMVVTA